MPKVNSITSNNVNYSNNMPKIVKRITKNNGDNYVITLKKNEYNDVQKGLKGYREWLTLYKEALIADGVKTYNKVKEKEIIAENDIRIMQKRAYDANGKKIIDFLVNSTGTMNINTPEVSATIGGDLHGNLILSKMLINPDFIKNEHFRFDTMRPEVKRLFKSIANLIK